MALTQNLDILYNEFMLQRTLVRHYRQPPDALLQVAQSLMTAVLEGSRAQGAFRHLSGCLPWLVCVLPLHPLSHLTHINTDCSSWTSSSWGIGA